MQRYSEYMIKYIQTTLYDGRQPDSNGFYRYSRKELSEGTQIAACTVSRYLDEVFQHLKNHYDFAKWAQYEEYQGEHLYTDVTLERGVLKFRRNPLTIDSELSFLWGLPFVSAYDMFDSKHRRWWFGSEMKYDAIPDQWNPNEHEEEIRVAREAVRKHQIEGNKTPVLKKEKLVLTENERLMLSIQKNGGRVLQKFAKKNITYELCLAAVSNAGTALEFVPEEFQTEELYKATVSSNGMALRFIPYEKRSFELCLIASCQDPEAIKYTPESMVTLDYCTAVALKHKQAAMKLLLENIPDNIQKEDLFTRLVAADFSMIWDIPYKYHTVELCNLAIQKMGYQSAKEAVHDNPEFLSQLHYSFYDHDVSWTFITSDLFKKAFSKSKYDYRDIDADLSKKGKLVYENRTYSLKHLLRWSDVCKIAFKHNKELIKNMSISCITQEMCDEAVHENPLLFGDIPAKNRTRKLSEFAVIERGFNVSFVPIEYLSEPMCIEAVKQLGSYLEDVPINMRTYTVCLNAVQNNAYAFKYVPNEIINKEICVAAAKEPYYNKYFILQRVPISVIDEDVCQAAVKANPENLKYIPERFMSYDLCAIVTESHFPNVEDYIPDRFKTTELYQKFYQNRVYVAPKKIPIDCLTEDMCLDWLKHMYLASRIASSYEHPYLKDIPVVFRTRKVCDLTMEDSPSNLKDVPPELVTKEYLLKTAAWHPDHLRYNFPDQFKTEEFFQELKDAYKYSNIQRVDWEELKQDLKIPNNMEFLNS